MVHNVADWHARKPRDQAEFEEAVAWAARIEAMHTLIAAGFT